MKLNLFRLVRKSVSFNLKGAVYQIVIIILLTAVITGSLMTGKSVKNSLKKASFEKLGNTGILVSSGIRYFDTSLVARMASKTHTTCTGLLEMDGYCQHFTSGLTAQGVKIYAIGNDFFPFQGNNEVHIAKGEVAVNERLASHLGLKQGDELIIRFNAISDIPSDAPFSPGKKTNASIVLRTGKILNSAESGNFSLGISQITPMNLFVNRSDITDDKGKIPKINRLIFGNRNNLSVSEIYNILSEILNPGDIGLSIRHLPKTGGLELISGRIFIDQFQVDELKEMSIPSFPVITYLANSIAKGNKFAPYSFISALDTEMYSDIPEGNGIVINKWLADDLNVHQGDSLKVTWYNPDAMNRLEEETKYFTVSRVVEMQNIWSDPLLMPEFPGIAGSKSCSDWDAGVSINMDLIRKKDEEYWNKFGGTPKAFINYEIGKELWGSNFGPATAIRFKADVSENELTIKLTRIFDPYKSGFIISDLQGESIAAANKSVDFSTLFLGLGFFIILSAVILLILVVSTYYESKIEQLTTFFSIGFSNHEIEKLLMIESGIFAVIGAVLGAFLGGLFNVFTIKALNSVWLGAVQTNTLSSGFDLWSLIIGFAATILIILVILKIKSSGFLKNLNKAETGKIKRPSFIRNKLITFILITATLILVILSFIFSDYSKMLSYSGGIMVFVTLVQMTRQYFLSGGKRDSYSFKNANQISGSYYSFNASHAIAPVLFLAAGLFAVIITGANKMNISANMLKPSGGTGGFLLWGESSLPLKDNLNSKSGRVEFGLNEDELKDLSLIQAKRTSGNDASCLNLNHVTSPPLLGIDPSEFIRKGSFSFSAGIKSIKKTNPWTTINYPPANGTIYGIADQTVLEYGLKIKTGDTLKIRSENGQMLNVIIAAGLKPSVFQGYVLIGSDNFSRFFPSVAGSQIFLADGDGKFSEVYKNSLQERLSDYGVHFEPASERLASFFVVTNTYLSVFTILGGIGMILGVAGLGFILIRNFNQRKRDFGLMMATGFSERRIRRIVFGEHARILLAGILTGLISALIATRPSIINSADIPWNTICLMICLVLLTGLTAIALSVKSIGKDSLISRIRKE
jgi:putative ABC transport system permease protein